MGCYVNPPLEEKEAFLRREGVQVARETLEHVWRGCPDGSLPVVLVDNGAFTAAAVAYKFKELQDFFWNRDDMRQKTIFYVPITKLKEVSPVDRYLE